MQAINIRPVTDLRNKFNEIEEDMFFAKNGCEGIGYAVH